MLFPLDECQRVLLPFSVPESHRPKRPRHHHIPPEWQTLGALLDAGNTVIAGCVHCSFHRTLDLTKVIEVKGRDFSLVDYRHKCPNRCGRGYVLFYVNRGMRNVPLANAQLRDDWLWGDDVRWRAADTRPEATPPPATRPA